MRELRNGSARLLVVDDNKVNRLLLDAQSRTARSQHRIGREWPHCAGDAAARAFDLLLLDMEMPEMDGFQVLEQLVNDRQLRDLPVIVTSSLEGIANVVRCIELGAEDYLTKPVNPVLLKARIGASLEKKRLRDQQKELMRRFATPEVAQDLQNSGFALGGKLVHASVMFSDIRGFTSLAESQPPEETIELLNTYYALMFDAISGHGGIVTLMMGDGLMSVFGAPVPLPDHCESAVRAAQEMVELIDLFNRRAAGRGQADDQNRHRHRLRRDGCRIRRHQRPGDLHLHRRHRQSGVAARDAYQGRATHHSDRPDNALGAWRATSRSSARPRSDQGQGDRGGCVFGRPRKGALTFRAIWGKNNE